MLLEQTGDGSPTRLAAVRFLLAQALAEAGKEPSRAKTLAEQARATYAEAGDDESKVSAVDTWLTAH